MPETPDRRLKLRPASTSTCQKQGRFFTWATTLGELVFDKALFRSPTRLFPENTIRFSVREASIINHTSLKDARMVGMEEVSEVVSSSCPTSGGVLSYASSEFLGFTEQTDLIISMGQGYYDAFSGMGIRFFVYYD